ncbi:MAG: hypothetical protein Kow0025_00880 [Thermodesulfovibrionales bacterium]
MAERNAAGPATCVGEFKGESPEIAMVINKVRLVSPTDMTVIVQGESGTGKGLIARIIHNESRRAGKPFVAVDCGSIPETLMESELFGFERGAFTGAFVRKEGKFELANGGTLFLDEITNLSHSVQAKLLCVLHDRKMQRLGGTREIDLDIRVIAATNRSLYEEFRAGRFREDLYYRLAEFDITLPPLRDRKEDIPLLVEHFISEACEEFGKEVAGISESAMRALVAYRWPGNVRELRNAIRRAILLSESDFIGEIETPGVTPAANGLSASDDFLEEGVSLREMARRAAKEVEAEMVRRALAKAKNNKTKAAKILKIDRVTLYSKMKDLGLRDVEPR